MTTLTAEELETGRRLLAAVDEATKLTQRWNAQADLRNWLVEHAAALIEGAVPREPTEAMLEACEQLPCVREINGVLSLHQLRSGRQLDLGVERVDAEIWRAMHDAATGRKKG